MLLIKCGEDNNGAVDGGVAAVVVYGLKFLSVLCMYVLVVLTPSQGSVSARLNWKHREKLKRLPS